MKPQIKSTSVLRLSQNWNVMVKVSMGDMALERDYNLDLLIDYDKVLENAYQTAAELIEILTPKSVCVC